jgi:hypothetical protein
MRSIRPTAAAARDAATAGPSRSDQRGFVDQPIGPGVKSRASPIREKLAARIRQCEWQGELVGPTGDGRRVGAGRAKSRNECAKCEKDAIRSCKERTGQPPSSKMARLNQPAADAREEINYWGNAIRSRNFPTHAHFRLLALCRFQFPGFRPNRPRRALTQSLLRLRGLPVCS